MRCPVAGPQQIVPRLRTSSTELHWIPHPGDSTHQKSGHHGWAVVGRDIGDRDWAAIDPRPLRKSKGVRFRFTPSLYFWQTIGTHVWCKSQEEHHDRCRPGHKTGRLILSAARGGRSCGDLCQIASPDCPPLACAWVDNLAWRRLIHVDLGGVFSNERVYTTTEAASAGAAA